VEGNLGGRGGIGLEYAILLPLFLVFLLDCYEGISFLCLCRDFVSRLIFRRRGNTGVLAPFNSLVLETVTCSKAFAAASTAAMVVVYGV
jgi:hypothetical protein